MVFGTRSRVGALAATGVAAAVVLSGCAGVESAGGGGDTLKLGVITAVGSSLTNYPDVEAGARAAVDAVNKAGGVNGKQVEFFFCNTRGEVNQAVACARQADQEGVDAVVGRVDVYSTQTLPVLEKAKIPDIGNVSAGAEVDYTSPNTFPLHAGNFGAYGAIPYAHKADGGKKYVFASIDLPIGIRQGEYAEKVARNVGLETAPMIKIPAQGVTDYAPYAQQIKDSGADAATVALGPAGFQAFVKAADSVGLTARLSGTAFTFGQSEGAGIGALANRMYVTAPFPSTDDKAVPGIAKYHEELDAAGAEDTPATRRLAGLNAWLSAHAALQVAGTVQGGVTRDSMTAALQRTSGMDLYGLVTFSPTELAGQQGTFARFPKSDYHALTVDSPIMKDAGLAPIPDPLQTVRGGEG
ncbi:ABC transporter substrate-binding protein [Pseudonocardia sp. KRD291]|uniref:ABC transporter substrate-binding protein n=1 Tax=Pseudonocardia sp. KRD291 TaxID=2792007 RepID=UPI001C4A2172|nr:ABC transporter substrate-binding protein [Pseudonocardia sp. KRD291]MBW0103445.1 ABC transporter substrate-binding protein [Pseudonocardia sp. KRD291]